SRDRHCLHRFPFIDVPPSRKTAFNRRICAPARLCHRRGRKAQKSAPPEGEALSILFPKAAFCGVSRVYLDLDFHSLWETGVKPKPLRLSVVFFPSHF